LDKKFGLRIRAAYTTLFQSLSGGSWDQFGAAGDFDVMMSWTAVGRGTENTGRLVVDFEERSGIGNRTPNDLGGQVATLQPTANTFNDRGWVVRDVFWTQRLWEGQVRFLIGRADSTDYFGSTWMQSANNSFYCWQLTRFVQFSLGAQSIFDPSNGPSHDVVGAFWGRLRIVI
jgi:hypothetical protein